MPLPKTTPIAILGAGAFGLSTALELANQGFTQISVYERDSQIPSRWSAANDLNKIMRVEYEDEFYTELAVVGLCLTYFIPYSNIRTCILGSQLPAK